MRDTPQSFKLPENMRKPTTKAVSAPLGLRLFLESPCAANKVGRRRETTEI
jgi:hypothetical protein